MKFKPGDHFKVYSADKTTWYIYHYEESGSKLIKSNCINVAPEVNSDPNDIDKWWYSPVKINHYSTKLGKILYK